jgi:hypothetical protein
MKTSATAARDSYYYTCLGHLGQCNTGRLTSVLPKVAKASIIVKLCVAVAGFFAFNTLTMETWHRPRLKMLAGLANILVYYSKCVCFSKTH